jgi:hypothetical protein
VLRALLTTAPPLNGRGYVARLPGLVARLNAVGCGRMRQRLRPRVNGLRAKLLKERNFRFSFWSFYESEGQLPLLQSPSTQSALCTTADSTPR